MSDHLVDMDDITVGSRYLWRAYRAAGNRLEIAIYRDDDGQLLWDVDAKAVRGAKSRALAVMVGGRQVRVTKVEGLRIKPPRVAIHFVDISVAPGGAVTPSGAEREATISFAHILDRLGEGNEVVDAVAE